MNIPRQGIPYDEAKDFTGLTEEELELLRKAHRPTVKPWGTLVVMSTPREDEGIYKMYLEETNDPT